MDTGQDTKRELTILQAAAEVYVMCVNDLGWKLDDGQKMTEPDFDIVELPNLVEVKLIDILDNNTSIESHFIKEVPQIEM